MRVVELLEIVNTVLVNMGRPKVSELSYEMSLKEDLGFASIDLAELAVRIEESTGVDVFADKIIETVGELLSPVAPEVT